MFTTRVVTTSTTTGRDGSTPEKAIVVSSIDAEYNWVKSNYPASRVVSQALISEQKKHYDLLTFVTSAGETKKAYFDITGFFGKTF